MKIASSPTQIAAQALAANTAPLRPQAAPRRIQTADLTELTKQSPQAATAAPVAREQQTSSSAAPTRPTRPGSLLDIKV